MILSLWHPKKSLPLTTKGNALTLYVQKCVKRFSETLPIFAKVSEKVITRFAHKFQKFQVKKCVKRFSETLAKIGKVSEKMITCFCTQNLKFFKSKNALKLFPKLWPKSAKFRKKCYHFTRSEKNEKKISGRKNFEKKFYFFRPAKVIAFFPKLCWFWPKFRKKF